MVWLGPLNEEEMEVWREALRARNEILRAERRANAALLRVISAQAFMIGMLLCLLRWPFDVQGSEGLGIAGGLTNASAWLLLWQANRLTRKSDES